MNIQQLLEITIERKASDLHLVVGYPPMVRLFGDLVPVTGADIISDSEIASLILSLLSPLQKQVSILPSNLILPSLFKAGQDFGSTYSGRRDTCQLLSG